MTLTSDFLARSVPLAGLVWALGACSAAPARPGEGHISLPHQGAAATVPGTPTNSAAASASTQPTVSASSAAASASTQPTVSAGSASSARPNDATKTDGSASTTDGGEIELCRRLAKRPPGYGDRELERCRLTLVNVRNASELSYECMGDCIRSDSKATAHEVMVTCDRKCATETSLLEAEARGRVTSAVWQIQSYCGGEGKEGALPPSGPAIPSSLALVAGGKRYKPSPQELQDDGLSCPRKYGSIFGPGSYRVQVQWVNDVGGALVRANIDADGDGWAELRIESHCQRGPDGKVACEDTPRLVRDPRH